MRPIGLWKNMDWKEVVLAVGAAILVASALAVLRDCVR
jgi:hypothetical protein